MVQGHYEQQNRAPHRNGEERIHTQKIEAAGQHLQHDDSENHTDDFAVASGGTRSTYRVASELVPSI